VILPGSKNTRFDLEMAENQRLAVAHRRLHAGGGHITGICGGYQMMGTASTIPTVWKAHRATTPGWTCCRWKPCSRRPRPRP
jgi:adenosylcobyric acid synthase